MSTVVACFFVLAGKCGEYIVQDFPSKQECEAVAEGMRKSPYNVFAFCKSKQ